MAHRFATVNASGFKNRNFWTGTLGFNTGGTYAGTPPWDLSGVISRGYPVLAGLGGP